MPSTKMEPPERVEEQVPAAMAFTVTFDSAKTTNNKFFRRHIRNLSLPISRIYDGKSTSEHEPVNMNGNPGKKQGNHSEGYFSSDPEEESSSTPNHIPDELKGECETTTDVMATEQNDAASDVASETGTYTIDKNDKPEIITARLSIDANFGVPNDSKTCLRESKQWISEWATQVVNHNKSLSPSLATTEVQSKSIVVKTSHGVSKIPSPLTTRARFGIKASKASKETSAKIPNTPRSAPASKEECSDSSLETESFLKTTEKVMSALAARMSVSLDSETEPNSKTALHHSDSSASESSFAQNTQSSTRYNRAVSLRRNGGGGAIARTDNSPPRTATGPRQSRKPIPVASVTPTPRLKPATPPISRTDTGRFSMRAKQPPQINTSNNGVGVTKKKTPGGGRSNSTLSSKEVEFQNWKRRKSYDPMKAAAEGKKKEAAKKQSTNVMTQSTTNATTTPKSPVSSVLRSASFHGTRQLGAASSSEEEEEITISAEEDDYHVPQAPKTSLETSPIGSHVSLYSTTNTSPGRTQHKIEGVDNLVVSAIYGLSNKLKGSACSILKKLRYLYDEENDKRRQLCVEIDSLEAGEASSPHKLPSKELAATLRNLKRLDATLKALDEILFDEDFDENE